MQRFISIGESHPNIAYLYALVGNTAMGVMQVLFKLATQSLSSFEVVTLRSICLIIFNCFVLRNVQQSPYIAKRAGTSFLTQSSSRW